MPIPNPIKKESEKEFITRCMSNDVMKEEYASKQRYAICKRVYDKSNELQEFKFHKSFDDFINI